MLRLSLLLAWGFPVLGVAAPPVFTKDIAPIIFQHCTVCHRPGNIGPFPLTNYQEVQSRARQLVRVTQEGLMPPWKPQPGHGEFAFDRRLDAAQLQRLQDWLAAGKPQGPAADLPPLPQFPEGWQLGKPDLILKLPRPYRIPAEGPDLYVHFPFELKLDQDIHIRGVEVRPSNLRVAHHGVGILDGSGTARKLDAASPEPGYIRFGGPGFLAAGFTPGYVPGQTPRLFDEGAAITIKKGTDLVLQMHYHPTGKEEGDQVEVGLYLTPKAPTRHMLGILMGTEKVDIPAGETHYIQRDTFKLPVNLKLMNIWGHMHMIGRELKVWAELPEGHSERLLWINDWDFAWQETYQYRKPILLPAGTVVHAEFRWDNSSQHPRNPHSPPRHISLGEGSTDEMAGLWLGGELNSSLELWGLLLANIGHYDHMVKEGRRYRERKSKEKKQ